MLEAEGVGKRYRGERGGGTVWAVKDVSISLSPGEVVGLVGDSGCGKTTLAKIISRLIEPDQGRVMVDGEDVTSLRGRGLRRYRRSLQLVFQHPESALDPQHRIAWSVAEAYRAAGVPPSERRVRLDELVDRIAFPMDILERFPGEVSGGEIQRVALARALIMRPRYLILDEPTSMLDVSVQACILQSLKRLGPELGLGILLISHDEEVVKVMCDRVYRMDKGCIIGGGKPADDSPEQASRCEEPHVS